MQELQTVIAHKLCEYCGDEWKNTVDDGAIYRDWAKQLLLIVAAHLIAKLKSVTPNTIRIVLGLSR